MIKDYGFIKVGAAAPKLKISDTIYNLEEIKKVIERAESEGVSILTFPELSMTSYTCGDLFGQDTLIKYCEDSVIDLCNFSKGRDILFFIGVPVKAGHFLFNCAAAVHDGKILGIIPKTYIPNYGEFYEKRWFSSAVCSSFSEVEYAGQKVPFGTGILFENREMPDLCIGAEICEDLWSPVPPSSFSAISGATVIVNLSASNELVNKAAYRIDLVSQQSARLIGAYIYSSSGVYESTTDLVFSGHLIIAENGAVLKQSERFGRESEIITAEIDIQRLSAERRKNLTFRDTVCQHSREMRKVPFSQKQIGCDSLDRYIDPYPFVPSNENTRDLRCREIFSIQVAGLAKRLQHTGIQKAVVGVSGGLDSTLALLVMIKTFDVLNLPRENIYTITMPGFGTTDRTYNNTVNLCRELKSNLKEIKIVDSVLQHFSDIGHDPEIFDVTYENAQARERTQILMDIANKIGGIVVGTGDLSEIALGWSTYNGDHMSMYAVNCSVPKTLVRSLVHWVAENEVDKNTRVILSDILDTPVSPELLPADRSGNISQKTEDIIGPYELHDFFLYHMMRYGAPPKKIAFLAGCAFAEKYSMQEIYKWLKYFYKRFFSMQFKRSCIPDGPKVGTISLSPRGDWRMPSDAVSAIWLKELDEMQQ